MCSKTVINLMAKYVYAYQHVATNWFMTRVHCHHLGTSDLCSVLIPIEEPWKKENKNTKTRLYKYNEMCQCSIARTFDFS